MSEWEMLHHKMTIDHLGLLPDFLQDWDMRPAKEQINQRYAHGEGWSPMNGFSMGSYYVLYYKGDAPLKPLARLVFRSELILFYNHAWLAIVQKDGSYEVSRVD